MYVTEGLPLPNSKRMVSFPTPTILWISDSNLGVWQFNSRLTQAPGVSSDPGSQGLSPTRLPPHQLPAVSEVPRLHPVLSGDYKFRGSHGSLTGSIICYNDSQSSGKYFLTMTGYCFLIITKDTLRNSQMEEMDRAKYGGGRCRASVPPPAVCDSVWLPRAFPWSMVSNFWILVNLIGEIQYVSVVFKNYLLRCNTHIKGAHTRSIQLTKFSRWTPLYNQHPAHKTQVTRTTHHYHPHIPFQSLPASLHPWTQILNTEISFTSFCIFYKRNHII